MRTTTLLSTLFLGATTMTASAAPNVATDPNIDPQVRAFLVQINKDAARFGSCRSQSLRTSSPVCRT